MNKFFLKQKTKGYLSIIGASLLNIIFGSIYIPGILNLYIASYFHSLDSSFNPEKSIIIFPCLGFCLHFWAPFSFKISKFLGFRFHLSCCLFMVVCSFYFPLEVGNFWFFFAVFGFLLGSSAGLVIFVTMFNANKYFPSRKGLVTGLILGSFGISAMVSSFFLMHFLNPNNIQATKDKNDGFYYFPEEISGKLQSSLRKLSFLYVIIGLIGVLLSYEFDERGEGKNEEITNLIKETKSDGKNQENQYGTTNEKNEENVIQINSEIQLKDKNNTIIRKEQGSLKETLKSKIFWILLVILIFSTSSGFFIAINFKNMGISHIHDDNFLNYIGIVGAVCNGGGRLLWGLIVDRFQFKNSYLALLMVQIVEGFTLKMVLNSQWLFLIWVSVSFFCLGGHFVLFPNFCMKAYGLDKGPEIYGFLIFGAFIGNLFQTGVVLGISEGIGLENLAFLFALFGVVCLLMAFSAKEIRNEK